MKKSSLILLILAGLLIICLIGSDLILRNRYDQIDKSDPFWNYTKLNKGVFHHIRMTGSNVTRVSFIPGPKGSMGVLNYWEQDSKNRIESSISDDTLFIKFKERTDPPNIRNWMKYHVLIAISCPDLISVNGLNSNLNLFKLKQKNLSVSLAGKSTMEVESYNPDFDTVFVSQKDSSQLQFEMSEDMKSSGIMHAKVLDVQIRERSILDVGHFQVQSIHQSIGDSAGIILSGSTLRTLKYIQ
jgi:hypothetical protein